MPTIQRPTAIAIIGVGFSGLLTATHLIKRATSPLTLYLVNDVYAFGKGPAYSTRSPKHLLNVPAAKMSAIHDDQDHFLNWLHNQEQYREIDKDTLGKAFMPRREYGNYLMSIWEQTLTSKPANIEVVNIQSKALDISSDGDSYKVSFANHSPVDCDYVILTTGNESPSNPNISDKKFYESRLYFKNPWNLNIKQDLPLDKDLLILGNALTMADTAIGLIDEGFKGTIHTLSPSGFSVQPHKQGYLTYSPLVAELKRPYKLHEIVSQVHRHIKMMARIGITAEPVTDSLRPLTQTIWRELSNEDKERFLRHIKSSWNKIRHRLPGHVHDYIQQQRLIGKIVAHKGKLHSITDANGSATVQYWDKESQKEKSLSVGCVINCTGPYIDISRSENELIKSLVAKGMIQPDPMKIGIHTDDQGRTINRDGSTSKGIYTMGGNLRGLLWESTAVPELKIQASKLADEILKSIG
jgi:uncharacterized NAD(P)/FAD-binding protein YdhS